MDFSRPVRFFLHSTRDSAASNGLLGREEENTTRHDTPGREAAKVFVVNVDANSTHTLQAQSAILHATSGTQTADRGGQTEDVEEVTNSAGMNGDPLYRSKCQEYRGKKVDLPVLNGRTSKVWRKNRAKKSVGEGQ